VTVTDEQYSDGQTKSTRQTFNNSEQTPRPVDTRPYDYQSQTIPPQEQDHDSGRHINPLDGQEVVDLLNQPDTNEDSRTPDIGTSSPSTAASSFPNGVFYGDLRQRGWSEAKIGGFLDGVSLRSGVDAEARDLPTFGRAGRGQPSGMH
jgi:hypothetical protein